MSRCVQPLDRILLDWGGALRRAEVYMEALEAPAAERDALARSAVERAFADANTPEGGAASALTLEALAALLLERNPVRGTGPPPRDEILGSEAFAAWRLAEWNEEALSGPAGKPLGAQPMPEPGPPLARAAMTPERFGGRLLGGRRSGRGGASDEGIRPRSAAARGGHRAWVRAGRLRRALLGFLVLIPSVIAGAFMLEVLPYQGHTLLESAIALLFAGLFGWISVGFWTAVFGFLVLIRRDRFAIVRGAGEAPVPFAPEGRTAVVMPISHEPVERVFSGLRAIRRSLARQGALAHCDFFVLSDSVDPDFCLEEETAWASWRREVGPHAGVFYRRRRARVKRKSGNVADFCRRWGSLYRYMVVLDADSVMSGEALVRLVDTMERNPGVGIIQTAPSVVRARSLFARIQQFSNALYGPLFAAGMHFWQLGDGPYWGHNAIIRTEAFMAHCGLPHLSGRPPLGGAILSHDFVEAALLGRAGYAIWLAYDLPGSYEETPASLLEEMDRDRRWCQGNLQHLRLLFTGGLRTTHRALFLNGVFAYVSALLWLCFLAASTGKAILDAVRGPDYFPSGPSLFPEWPVWRPDWALSLLAVTAMILFVPKILAASLALARTSSARRYGGRFALLGSVLLEIVASALFAPIRMMFYCRFVLANLFGRAVSWGAAPGAGETSWREAFRRHLLDASVGSAWALAVHALNPQYFWWLAPVVAALVFSVPLSVLVSRDAVGEAARRRRLFLTPGEVEPPDEVLDLDVELARAAEEKRRRAIAGAGFPRAVTDPHANALHCALLRAPRSYGTRQRVARDALVERALTRGPRDLSLAEQRVLFSDGERMRALHAGVWRTEDREAVARWGVPPRVASVVPSGPREG